MGAYNESIENLTKSIKLLEVQKEPPAGLIEVVEKFKVSVISKKVRKIRTLKTGIEKVSLRNRKMDFGEYLSQNPAGDEKDYDFNGVSQLYIDLDVNNFHEKRDGPPEYPLMDSDRSTVKSGNFGNKKYDRPVAMDLLAIELEGYDQANSARKPQHKFSKDSSLVDADLSGFGLPSNMAGIFNQKSSMLKSTSGNINFNHSQQMGHESDRSGNSSYSGAGRESGGYHVRPGFMQTRQKLVKTKYHTGSQNSSQSQRSLEENFVETVKKGPNKFNLDFQNTKGVFGQSRQRDMFMKKPNSEKNFLIKQNNFMPNKTTMLPGKTGQSGSKSFLDSNMLQNIGVMEWENDEDSHDGIHSGQAMFHKTMPIGGPASTKLGSTQPWPAPGGQQAPAEAWELPVKDDELERTNRLKFLSGLSGGIPEISLYDIGNKKTKFNRPAISPEQQTGSPTKTIVKDYAVANLMRSPSKETHIGGNLQFLETRDIKFESDVDSEQVKVVNIEADSDRGKSDRMSFLNQIMERARELKATQEIEVRVEGEDSSSYHSTPEQSIAQTEVYERKPQIFDETYWKHGRGFPAQRYEETLLYMEEYDEVRSARSEHDSVLPERESPTVIQQKYDNYRQGLVKISKFTKTYCHGVHLNTTLTKASTKASNPPTLIHRTAKKIKFVDSRLNSEYFHYFQVNFFRVQPKAHLKSDPMGASPGPNLVIKLNCITDYMKNCEHVIKLKDYCSSFEPEFVEEFYSLSNLGEISAGLLDDLYFMDERIMWSKPMFYLIKNFDEGVRGELQGGRGIDDGQTIVHEYGSDYSTTLSRDGDSEDSGQKLTGEEKAENKAKRAENHRKQKIKDGLMWMDQSSVEKMASSDNPQAHLCRTYLDSVKRIQNFWRLYY